MHVHIQMRIMRLHVTMRWLKKVVSDNLIQQDGCYTCQAPWVVTCGLAETTWTKEKNLNQIKLLPFIHEIPKQVCIYNLTQEKVPCSFSRGKRKKIVPTFTRPTGYWFSRVHSLFGSGLEFSRMVHRSIQQCWKP